MQHNLGRLLRYRGASSDDIDKLAPPLCILAALFAVPLAIVVGYRNFVIEPTPLAVPILLGDLLPIVLLLPIRALTNRARIQILATVLLIMSIMIQYRNPAVPLISYYTMVPALVLLVATSGLRLGLLLLPLMVVTLGWITATFAAQQSTIFITNGFAFVVLTAVLLIFISALLVLREEHVGAVEEATLLREQRNAEREWVLRAFTRELATPMHALFSFGYDPELPANTRRLLSRIAQDLSDTVTDLRQTLSPEHTDNTLELSNSNLPDLVSAVGRQMQPLFADRGARLTLLNPQLPVSSYRIDARKLRVILSHLLNIIYRSSGASEIKVQVTARVSDVGDQQHRLRIAITHNGVALPAPVQDRFFNAGIGRHLPETDTSELARDIRWLHAMGGTLYYEVLPEGGVRMLAEMMVEPVSVEEGPSAQLYEDTGQPLRGVRALVLEADPLVARAASTLLRVRGCSTVDTVADNSGLLARIQSGRHYGFFVLDEDTAGEDLQGVLKLLRHTLPDAQVIITGAHINKAGSSAQLDDERLAQWGADACAQRPLTSSGLSRILSDLSEV